MSYLRVPWPIVAVFTVPTIVAIVMVGQMLTIQDTLKDNLLALQMVVNVMKDDIHKVRERTSVNEARNQILDRRMNKLEERYEKQY